MVARPELGYVQGMSYLAAMLVLFTAGIAVRAAQPWKRVGGSERVSVALQVGGLSEPGRASVKIEAGTGSPLASAPLGVSSSGSPIQARYRALVTLSSDRDSPALRRSPLTRTASVGASAPMDVLPRGVHSAGVASSQSMPLPGTLDSSISRATSALSPLASTHMAGRSQLFPISAPAPAAFDAPSIAMRSSTLMAVAEEQATGARRCLVAPRNTSDRLGELTVADDRFITFQALYNLMSRHHLYVFYAMDAGPLAPYYDMFDRVLLARTPALARHLHACGVMTEMYLFGWLQTVFIKALPFDAASRIWDCFLLEGTPYLYRVACALIDLLSPVILRGGGAPPDETIQLLTQPPAMRSTWLPVWSAIAAPHILMPAIDSVHLPKELVVELEDLTHDPFFYRRVAPSRMLTRASIPRGSLRPATAPGNLGWGTSRATGQRSGSTASSASACVWE